MEEFVKQIEAMKAVGEEVAKIEAATTEEEVKLLDQIVKRLLPVMRYIDYRVKISGSVGGGQRAEWSYDYAEEKAIVVINKSRKKATDRDYRGIYEGPTLLLTRSGKFMRMDKEGEWSNWQEEGSYWTSEISEKTTEQAIKAFGFEEIIVGISEEFKDAIEKAETKRQALNSRMEQIDKIKAILGA